MRLKIEEIARVLGSENEVKKPEGVIEILLTDSRQLLNPAVSLFFALPTAGNDGHRYIGELYRKGVRNFVISHEVDEASMPEATFLKVDNSFAALQKVGLAARRRFAGEMVGITGSRGKTTLKEWLFQLMEPLTEMVRSPRSFNSQIGVPLSLWELTETTRLAIIEAGISTRGEMLPLTRIIMPDTVIITNLGEAHSAGFDNDSEKLDEKLILASANTVKRIIYTVDNTLIAEKVATLPGDARKIGWSIKGVEAPLQGSVSHPTEGKAHIEYTYEGKRGNVDVPYREDYDVENGMHALAFMLSEGYTPEEIARRFEDLHLIATRLNVSEGVNNCNLIYDSYTSDFASLIPAVSFMRRRTPAGANMTCILSDVRHESYAAGDLYTSLADLVKRAGIHRIIGVGKNLKAHASLFGQDSIFFDTTEELLTTLSLSDFVGETILIKGSPEYDFEGVLEMLEAKKHETVLEVNLDAIVKNYNYFRRHLPPTTGLVAMVKASGYGAGSYEIAKTMQDQGAAYLAVAVLDEGIDLRHRGITMPIMVMNPKVVNYKSMFAFSLEPEIYNFEMLADVIREGEKDGVKGYPIHIKLDTGMHRMGFIESELPKVVAMVKGTDSVKIRSVFSHLATADCPDMNDYTELQLRRFREYTDFLQSQFDYRILRHVLNSAGILRYGNEHHYDMARLGIGLYGANTLPPEIEKPLAVVSTLRTVIIAIREWKAGETVGYGRRGVLKRDSRIATIPIGYADGMNRHFGNGNIRVLINGKEAPTVGNICMDACMIDVTGVECKVGDDVEIFGSNMPVQRLADVLDTIPYEILTSVSPRVKRVYYRE